MSVMQNVSPTIVSQNPKIRSRTSQWTYRLLPYPRLLPQRLLNLLNPLLNPSFNPLTPLAQVTQRVEYQHLPFHHPNSPFRIPNTNFPTGQTPPQTQIPLPILLNQHLHLV